MTVELLGQDVDNFLFWNIPNLNGDTANNGWNLVFKSQHSNMEVDLNVITLSVTGNDRFSKVNFAIIPPAIPAAQHINGIYEVELSNTSLGLSYKQVVKLITNTGGTTGTTPYISNNEDREAIVYYKPEY
tara:strand:- start:3263 stop:3652 length:390 start_codon:yes stop_codon:yes gene_type:complete